MKKAGLLSALSAVLILVSSCTKEAESLESNPYGVSSDAKMLKFETAEGYENVLANLSLEQREEFISTVNAMNYVSLSESEDMGAESLIQDKFISSILNEDYIVQIGNYVYRIDKSNGLVYVVEEDKLQAYSELVDAEAATENILEYSIEDDVVYLVENGMSSNAKLFCSEDACGADSKSVGLQDGGRLITLNVNYEKVGIIASASMTVSSNATFSNTNRVYVQMENIWHKPKCEDAVGPMSQPWWSGGCHCGYSKAYTVYSGTKRLNGYHLKARIRYEVGSTTSYSTYFSSWAEIERNSPY